MLTTIIHRCESWAGKHARVLFGVAVFAVVSLALVLRTAHLTDIGSRSPDERVYAQYAQRVALDGLGAYREMFSDYAAEPSRWLYPSPSRLVHVLAFAAVMKVTGSSTPQAGAAVSWAFGIASVLLLAAFGRRFFGRATGLWAALFLATYVVELEFARRAWGESTATFLSLALMYAACALESQPARWRWRLAFFAAGTACLLLKETSAFAYVLCGLWLIGCRLAKSRDAAGAALLAAAGLASVLVAFGVLALLSGSVGHALACVLHELGSGLGSKEWGAQNASGPWYRFGQLLWLMAPLTASMALLGAVAVVKPRATRVFEGFEPSARTPASLALLLVLGFVGASAFGPNLQYLRIMAPANPSYCLLAALGVRLLLTQSEDWVRGRVYPLLTILLPVAIAVMSVRDYTLYRDVVIASGMQDLTVPWLMQGIERRDDRQLASSQKALQGSPPEAAAPGAPRALTPQPLGPGATPKALLERSVQHCRRQEYAACVRAAKAALQGDPKLAEAWNNAAAGYAGLHLWDDAARHASQALRLRPDFQLAKNNLAWISEERAKLLAAP
jgi:tetratricopeptide (TPR) repeat protein